jgi:SAM-dependent methyltransferase
MDAILDALSSHSRGTFRVLDLGSGPGSLPVRILRRFPRCRVIALDTDPVLIEVGRRALARFGKRISWVLADLREKGWSSGLPVRRYDVVVSSLALHWLEEDEIRAIYRDLRTLLRPGSLLVNGDFLPSGLSKREIGRRRQPAENDRVKGRRDTTLRAFKERWGAWWESLSELPSMRIPLKERQSRMPGAIPPRRTTGPKTPATLEFHQQALRDARFREAQVVWRERDFRVLIGTR